MNIGAAAPRQEEDLILHVSPLSSPTFDPVRRGNASARAAWAGEA
jgi:hypothetical protein